MDAKKRYFRLFLALFVMACLSGCSSGAAPADTTESQNSDHTPTESTALPPETALTLQPTVPKEPIETPQEQDEVDPSVYVDDYTPPTKPVASGSCGDDVYWALDDGGVVTIYGTGDMWNYSDCGPWLTDISRVVIRDGITSIGSHAFDNCSASSYIIGSRVRFIGERAFYSSNARDILLPESLEEIGDEAFLSCWLLDSITIPKSVSYIGSSAFASCQELQVINVDTDNPYYCGENGILFSKDKTYLVCVPQGLSARMTQYEIPHGVVRIADGALKLAKFNIVSIPDTVEEIGSFSFAYCSNIKSITMPESVTRVAPYAFYHCKNLEGVSISKNLEAISDGMFEECDNLSNVIIPSGVTSIGAQAFRRCKLLLSISIPQSVGYIGDYAFETAKLDNVYYEGSEGDWNQIAMNQSSNSILTRTQIHYAAGSDNVPQISEAELNDPYSGRCNQDIRWRYDGNGTLTISGNGKMNDYSSDTRPEWQDFIDSITTIIIEDGVTRIGNQAFFYHPQLQHIQIAGSVTIIGGDAISRCDSITEIVIPEGTVSLGQYAIRGCNSLKTIYLPSTFGSTNFGITGNYALTDIYYNGTEDQWNQLEFGPMAFLPGGITVHFSDGTVINKNMSGH